MNAKVAAPLIGALGAIIAAAIVTFGSGGGGGETKVVLVPTPMQGQPTPMQGQPGQVVPRADAGSGPVPAPPSDVPVRITVLAELDDGQAGARIAVYLGDVKRGTIELDEEEDAVTLRIDLPRAGTYTYRLEAEGRVYDEAGGLVRAWAAGSGTIGVRAGDQFEVVLEESTGENRLFLRAR